MENPLIPDKQILIELVRTKMPFGRFEAQLICDLPISYLEWFARKGFPKGRLGVLLETMLVIKSNGLTQLLEPIKRMI
ncbi:MAG: DUF3820 family protein [Bacteroidia bacterium]